MAFGGPPALATSERKPKLVLVAGAGNLSGVPRHITHLIAALKDQAEITVFSDTNTDGFEYDANQRIVPGLSSSLSMRALWRGWRGLLRALRHHPADLVWLHARLPVLFARLMLALRLWRPKHNVAFTLHGLPFGKGHHPMVSSLAMALEKLLMATIPPSDIIFLTEEMRLRMQHAIGKTRLSRHRLHILPNCSDLGPFPKRINVNQRNLIMTGRTGWQKDLKTAIRLFAKLPDDFTLTLCGPGTDAADFQKDIRSEIPATTYARITFAGPQTDVRPFLATADAYLLTSRYEGLPIGALEAFEAGLPIILRAFDGAQELADKHPAALVLSCDNPSSDAAAISAHVQPIDPKTTAEIRDAWTRHFSPDVFNKTARHLFSKLTAAMPTP